MNETVNLVFVLLMVTPATLFPLMYGIQAKWWRSHVGRAMMFHGVGMMLLIDTSAITKVLGVQRFPGDWIVTLAILVFILVGLWYILIAYLIEKRRGRNRKWIGNGHDNEVQTG